MLAIIAIAITIGVYGLVAGIVNTDDLGLYLMKNTGNARQKIGHLIGVFENITTMLLNTVVGLIVGVVVVFIVALIGKIRANKSASVN